jgi:hypothetical protein
MECRAARERGLLLQPHGFEGFGAGAININAHEQPVLDRVNEGGLQINPRAAVPLASGFVRKLAENSVEEWCGSMPVGA